TGLREAHRAARRQLDQCRDQQQQRGCECEADDGHDDVYEAPAPVLSINGVEWRCVYERERRSAGSYRSVRRERRRHSAQTWQRTCARRGRCRKRAHALTCTGSLPAALPFLALRYGGEKVSVELS